MSCRDWTSAEGAKALAERLEAFWAKAGFPCVRAEVVPMGVTNKVGGSVIYGVKTNLLPGGRPPSCVAA